MVAPRSKHPRPESTPEEVFTLVAAFHADPTAAAGAPRAGARVLAAVGLPGGVVAGGGLSGSVGGGVDGSPGLPAPPGCRRGRVMLLDDVGRLYRRRQRAALTLPVYRAPGGSTLGTWIGAAGGGGSGGPGREDPGQPQTFSAWSSLPSNGGGFSWRRGLSGAVVFSDAFQNGAIDAPWRTIAGGWAEDAPGIQATTFGTNIIGAGLTTGPACSMTATVDPAGDVFLMGICAGYSGGAIDRGYWLFIGADTTVYLYRYESGFSVNVGADISSGSFPMSMTLGVTAGGLVTVTGGASIAYLDALPLAAGDVGLSASFGGACRSMTLTA